MEQMYRTLYLLRTQYRFRGYIHVKAIPGAAPELIEQTGYLADRMSVNLELPTAEGMKSWLRIRHTTVFSADSADPEGNWGISTSLGKDPRMERHQINRHLSGTILRMEA